MRLVRISAVIATLALIGAACGGNGTDSPTAEETPVSFRQSFQQSLEGADVFPVPASSEVVVGENRLLLGLLNDENAPVGSPDTSMHVDFYNLSDGDEEADAAEDMEFIWIEEPFRGLYQGSVAFDEPGKWGAEVAMTGGGVDETVRISLDVAKKSSTPAIGAKVPASDTPTLDDVSDLSEISTDTDPTRRFYQTSVREAVRSNQSFVLIFATPKFCASATCGPMLDNVDAVADDFPEVTFIHVEPYDLDKVPEELVPVESTLEWGLPSEPWVFVVNSKGRLVAKYEGVLDPAGLRKNLQRL